MAEIPLEPRTSSDETILQQQYLRALSSFEGIVLSQIDVKNKLGDRLNYSIRAGLIILSVIAFSIGSRRLPTIAEPIFSPVTCRTGTVATNIVSPASKVSPLYSTVSSSTISWVPWST